MAAHKHRVTTPSLPLHNKAGETFKWQALIWTHLPAIPIRYRRVLPGEANSGATVRAAAVSPLQFSLFLPFKKKKEQVHTEFFLFFFSKAKRSHDSFFQPFNRAGRPLTCHVSRPLTLFRHRTSGSRPAECLLIDL